MVKAKVSNQVTKVTAGSYNKETSVTSTNNPSQYWANVAEAWAKKMDGMVANEDYSAKYYATKAKEEHDFVLQNVAIVENIAETSIENINTIRTEAVRDIESAVSSIDSQISAGVEELNHSTTEGIESIETTTVASLTNITNTVSDSLYNINSSVTDGINTIETTKTEASEYVETTANESIAEVNQAKEQAIKDFNKASDKVNYLFVMPIGTIGFSPFPIDETKGLRRILNGQIIIQEQFTGFVKWLKENIELYPQMACTEEEWQTTVTMSVYGQCGKFVIDDEAGTIRLPRITGFIQGLTDLASLGELVEAGLPTITTDSQGAHTHTRGTMDITGTLNAISDIAVGTAGAFTYSTTGATNSNLIDTASKSGQGKITFTASKNWSGTTSSNGAHQHTIAGTADTVQPEAIRYPYFIQVATGVEETINTTREIELNNPFFFGYYQYFETTPNNISWLKSQGQWNSKAVYTDYYDWILTNANNSVENFKLSTDTYDDYAWVVNTADETFRLPIKTKNAPFTVSGTATTTVSTSENTNVSLYFYVGETVQNANLVNVGRIEETVVNKINRTGDTMTGNLLVEKEMPIILLKNSNIESSVPSDVNTGVSYFAIHDKNGQAMGQVGLERYTNGRQTIKLQAFSADGTSAPAVRVNAYANNTIGCEFPRCTTKATTTSSARNDLVAVVVQNYVSGTSWYRVWSDGWIEQGGQTSKRTSNGALTIKFLKSFSNTNYVPLISNFQSGGIAQESDSIQSKTTSQMVVFGWEDRATTWYACGY